MRNQIIAASILLVNGLNKKMTGHNYEVEVVPIGDSLGIILPDTAVRHLEVVVGDEVFITETPTDFQITSITTAMRRGMDENRGVLRRLAGS